MLLRESDIQSAHTRRRSGGASRGVSLLLTLAIVTVLVLRHDYWNWDTPGYLLFGFLPVGLWWQAMVSVLAMLVMWGLVRFAWPDDVEAEAMAAEEQSDRQPTANNPLNQDRRPQ